MAIQITIPGSGGDALDIPGVVYTKWSQSFPSGSGFRIESISLMMSLGAGTPGNVLCNIYATDGSHNPTGVSLASASIAASSLNVFPSWSYPLFTFSTPYLLSASTQYCFVITTSAGVSPTDYIYLGATLGNPYAGGETRGWDDGGAQWVNVATFDIRATIRSQDAPNKATNPNPTNGTTSASVYQSELTWTSDPLSIYDDVYFGVTGNLQLVDEENTSESFDLSNYLPLVYNTTYQWRIDSYDQEYDKVTGDTWSFTPGLSYPGSGSGAGAGGASEYNMIKRLTAAARRTFWYEDI